MRLAVLAAFAVIPETNIPMCCMELTPLENDIVGWLLKNCEDSDVQRQLPQIHLRKRDYTGVGFFLHFSLPPDVIAAPESVGDVTPIPGPEIASSQLDSGAGTVIFLTDGRLDCLEIFAYGNHFPETLTDYTLA
jgi:hypothetical protein